MAFTKPMVTIELAEYTELTKKASLKNSVLTVEQYESCYTALVVAAIQHSGLINNPPVTGVILQTPSGQFVAKLGTDRIFRFTKHGA